MIVPVPSTTGMHLPDPKWSRRNFRDVDAMRQFAWHEQKKHHDEAAELATAMLARWPFTEEPRPIHAAGLVASLALGLGYGNVAKGEAMRREVWEALCFSAGMDTPREPQPVVAAFVYACFAGNYLARSAEDASELVVDLLDWEDVVSVSPRVAVVQEATEAVWNATKANAS